ncbi:MAG: hypothetical protein EXQ96_02250 [Alphaproteobacteria bacterium]|nr:hypothetical protein [Alphaproteobacteria bacterium]
MLVLSGLWPFLPRSRAVAIEWLPSADLPSVVPVALGAIAREVLLFGGTVALIRAAGAPALGATIAITLVAALVEFGQVFLASGAPGLTAPVLAFATGCLISATVPPRARSLRRAPPAPGIDMRAPDQATARAEPAPTRGLGAAVLLGIAGTGLVVGLLLLRPPTLGPRLATGAGPLAPLVVTAALLWIGAGAALVGGRLAVAARPWLEAPVLTLLAGALAAALLVAGVDGGSLRRLLGGAGGAGGMAMIDAAWRALAFVVALALPLAAAVAAGMRASQHRDLPLARRAAIFSLALTVYAVQLTPWWAVAAIGLAVGGVGTLVARGGPSAAVALLLWLTVVVLAAALLARVLSGREAHPIALIGLTALLVVPVALLLTYGGGAVLGAVVPAGMSTPLGAALVHGAATLIAALGAAIPLALHRPWVGAPRA